MQRKVVFLSIGSLFGVFKPISIFPGFASSFYLDDHIPFHDKILYTVWDLKSFGPMVELGKPVDDQRLFQFVCLLTKERE